MSKPKPIYVHRLEGCRPTPLAHYLKALGIFRLIAEQADPDVRGWWKDDVFHIATALDQESLESFFLNDYSPTPMTAPWLARSGYSDASSHSKTRKHLTLILECQESRFEGFRDTFEKMRSLAATIETDLDQPDTCRNEEFIVSALTHVSAVTRDWMRSMVVAFGENINYPAVFGTGGNEGSGSYIAQYYVAIVACLVGKEASIGNSLWLENRPSDDNALKTLTRGNFSSGHFSTSESMDDPWDLILALEGVTSLKASVARRMSESIGRFVEGTGASMAAPFTTGNSCSAYPSSARIDSKSVSQGREAPGRGEQWFPIWQYPANLTDVQQLFRHGRMTSRPSQTRRSVDFARALSRTGASKGLISFQRVGYFQRNGKNHIAVPLGTYPVTLNRNQKLLDDAAPWVDHFRRVANAKNAPASLLRAHQACEEAIVVCTQRPSGISFLRLLEAMGQAEDEFLTSPKHAKDNFAKPIPKLPKAWARLIFEELHSNPEVRLAFSLAAQSGPKRSRDKNRVAEMVEMRHHWLPIDGQFFKTSEGGLAMSPTQCANGLNLERALIAIMNRRLIEMSSGVTAGFIPLAITNWLFGAEVEHIEAFLEHRVDDAKVLSIARGLMAIDFSYSKATHDQSTSANVSNGVDAKDPKNRQPLGGLAAYGLLKLAHPNHKKGVSVGKNKNVIVKCNPTIFRRLRTGGLGKSVTLAARQLSIAGLRPRFQVAVGSTAFAKRLAASLAFGIAPPLLSRIALGLTAPELDSTERRKLAAHADET